MADRKSKEQEIVDSSVFVESVQMPEGSEVVGGYDFNEGVDFEKLFNSYRTMGFQATNVAKGIDEINNMIKWRLSDEERDEDDDRTEEERQKVRCKIYLGYTSNLISSGLREVIRYLVQHKMVDVIVTTAGGIEEDFIKCLAPTYLGDFSLKGSWLRDQGLNRIGNLIVPNDNYCKFQDWIIPIFDKMLEEQKEGKIWTPSRVIHRLGKEINDERSVYYWAYKNNIPVFCPAITDGSIGDMMYLHTFRQKEPEEESLIVDLVRDIKAMNSTAVYAEKTGMIILGGGVVKHHICNANLMRNGADYAVFINTGQEFDGSDAGARPDEAISWGKIKSEAKPVKIYTDATLVFPFMVGMTFAKNFEPKGEEEEETY